MDYPIVLVKEIGGRYSVFVPDLPGCVTYGEDIKHGIRMASEAVVGHIQTLMELERPVPPPGSVENYVNQPEFKSGVWFMLRVPDEKIVSKAVKVTITMPEASIPVIDGYAQKVGKNRSSFLVMAALNFVREHDLPVMTGSAKVVRLHTHAGAGTKPKLKPTALKKPKARR